MLVHSPVAGPYSLQRNADIALFVVLLLLLLHLPPLMLLLHCSHSMAPVQVNSVLAFPLLIQDSPGGTLASPPLQSAFFDLASLLAVTYCLERLLLLLLLGNCELSTMPRDRHYNQMWTWVSTGCCLRRLQLRLRDWLGNTIHCHCLSMLGSLEGGFGH